MKKIKYEVAVERNRGSEQSPDIELILFAVEKECMEQFLDDNLVIAREESYNGEVTVEEVEDEETEPTTEERVDDLEASAAALEDAMCEMDAATEERIAAIEDALCEMDMA